MDVQTVSIVIAAVSVVIGVISSILSNRRSDEQRQVQLVSQLYEHLLDKDFAADISELILQWDFTDYEDYKPKYSVTTGHFEEYSKMIRVGRFLNHACELIDKGIIDTKFISEQVAWDIIRYYEKFEPVIKGARIALNNPLAFDDIESVYPRLQKQRQQKIELLQQA